MAGCGAILFRDIDRRVGKTPATIVAVKMLAYIADGKILLFSEAALSQRSGSAPFSKPARFVGRREFFPDIHFEDLAWASDIRSDDFAWHRRMVNTRRRIFGPSRHGGVVFFFRDSGVGWRCASSQARDSSTTFGFCKSIAIFTFTFSRPVVYRVGDRPCQPHAVTNKKAAFWYGLTCLPVSTVSVCAGSPAKGRLPHQAAGRS